MLPTELFARYIAALNARDFEQVQGLLADPIEFHVINSDTVLTSSEAVVAGYRSIYEQLPDGRLEVLLAFGDEEWLGSRIELQFTAGGERQIVVAAILQHWVDDKLVLYKAYPESTVPAVEAVWDDIATTR